MTKVDIKEIYKKCSKGKKRISGTDVRLFIESPFAVFCRHFVDEKLKDPRSEYFELLFERGNEHETNAVEELYPKAEECEVEDRKQGFMMLLQEMQKGTESLHNFPLLYLPEGLHGEFDVLEKRKGRSDFGNYYYIVKEIKHAKHIKEKHAMQAALYNYILGKIQGYTPEKFYLINREFKSKGFHFADFKDRLKEIIESVNKILDKKKASATYNSCSYPWKEFCNKNAIKQNDVSLAAEVGLKRKIVLNNMGITKVQDLAKVPVEKLMDLPAVGKKTAESMQRSAQAISTKKPIVFKSINMPEAKTIVYLDLEGTDEEELVKTDYLFGILVNGKYHSFVAKKLKDEKKAFFDFLDHLKKYDNYLLYHFGDYERVRLRHLVEKHKRGKRILDKLVNLHMIVRDHIAFPTYGHGLKEIAKYLGFKWRQKEVTAMESVALYYDFLETGEKKKLQKVIDYNEDDCRATAIIKEYLDKINSS